MVEGLFMLLTYISVLITVYWLLTQDHVPNRETPGGILAMKEPEVQRGRQAPKGRRAKLGPGSSRLGRHS